MLALVRWHFLHTRVRQWRILIPILCTSMESQSISVTPRLSSWKLSFPICTRQRIGLGISMHITAPTETIWFTLCCVALAIFRIIHSVKVSCFSMCLLRIFICGWVECELLNKRGLYWRLNFSGSFSVFFRNRCRLPAVTSGLTAGV